MTGVLQLQVLFQW